MADSTTTGLPDATLPLGGTEKFYTVQSGNSRKVAGSEIVKIAHNQAWSTITSTPTSLTGYGITDAATSAQGTKADSAVQPGDLATVATTGAYSDLSGKPTLGTAAATNASAYATAAQGTKADSALQSTDIGTSVQAQGDTLDSLEGLSLVSGDVIYATAADTLARLAKGTDGQVLKLASGVPSWGTVAGSGDVVGPSSVTDGNLALFDGTTGKVIKDGGVPFSGDYTDLTSKPTLGTAAASDTGDFATAAQGTKADSAVQISDAGILSGFRNKLINGNFDVWQHGTSLANAGYLADRWYVGGGGADYAYTQSRQAITPGDVDATYCMQLLQTGGANTAYIPQKIEDVRTLSGKRCTVTVWAKNAGNNPNIGVRIDQNFGSGGSSTVSGSISAKAITTGWARYDFVIDIPAISGKTIGADSYLFVYIFNATSGANTYPSTLQITHCSIVEGDATSDDDPFAARHIQQETALCQRYFQKYEMVVETNSVNSPLTLPVTMRTVPSVSGGGTGYTMFSTSPTIIGHYQTTRAIQTLSFDAEL